jgi:hypothetical protein
LADDDRNDHEGQERVPARDAPAEAEQTRTKGRLLRDHRSDGGVAERLRPIVIEALTFEEEVADPEDERVGVGEGARPLAQREELLPQGRGAFVALAFEDGDELRLEVVGRDGAQRPLEERRGHDQDRHPRRDTARRVVPEVVEDAEVEEDDPQPVCDRVDRVTVRGGQLLRAGERAVDAVEHAPEFEERHGRDVIPPVVVGHCPARGRSEQRLHQGHLVRRDRRGQEGPGDGERDRVAVVRVERVF